MTVDVVVKFPACVLHFMGDSGLYIIPLVIFTFNIMEIHPLFNSIHNLL